MPGTNVRPTESESLEMGHRQVYIFKMLCRLSSCSGQDENSKIKEILRRTIRQDLIDWTWWVRKR